MDKTRLEYEPLLVLKFFKRPPRFQIKDNFFREIREKTLSERLYCLKHFY
jgi:hypothetical protein